MSKVNKKRRGKALSNEIYFDKSPLKEPEPVPVPKKLAEQGNIHIDVYLRAKGVPLWERGGKRAFAVKHGKEFATEKELDALFVNY